MIVAARMSREAEMFRPRRCQSALFAVTAETAFVLVFILKSPLGALNRTTASVMR